MTERELLLDCLRRLNGTQIPYMLTGSMASNYWGIPRTTHDLDFVIQLDASAVPRLVSKFDGDFFIQDSSVRSAMKPPYQFNAIDQRSSLKVDFWILKPNEFEQNMFARRRQMTIAEIAAWIGTAEDVLLHKLVWNKKTPSERQLSDAAGIWLLQRDSMDLDYLASWADKLGVKEELDRIKTGQTMPKTS